MRRSPGPVAKMRAPLIEAHLILFKSCTASSNPSCALNWNYQCMETGRWIIPAVVRQLASCEVV